MNELPPAIELTDESAIDLIKICIKNNMTPAQVISEIIREAAAIEGLIKRAG